jgi:hypothetical protein
MSNESTNPSGEKLSLLVFSMRPMRWSSKAGQTPSS